MEIVISPSQNLYVQLNGSTHPDDILIKNHFNECCAKGLLALLNYRSLRQRSLSLSYWFEFASSFLRTSCHALESDNPILKASSHLIQKFFFERPTIPGCEYIDENFLISLWDKLACFMQEEYKRFLPATPRQYVATYFPDWAQVGQIHFHLAENPTSTSNPFAFLATYTTRLSDKARIQHVPLAQAIKETSHQNENLLNLLHPIKQAGVQARFINELLISKKIFQPIYFTTKETYRFLHETSYCEEAGIVVKLPKQWQGKKPHKAMVSIKIDDQKKTSFVGFDSLFKFYANVSIGGQLLSSEEWAKLMACEEQLVQIKGQWVTYDKEKISALLAKWHQLTSLHKQGFTFAEAARILSGTFLNKKLDSEDGTFEDDQNNWVEFKASKNLSEIFAQMRSPSLIEHYENKNILAKNLQANLRPYQLEGVSWLLLMTKLGLGGCLADDMGLGKTIQIISLLLLEKARTNREKNPSLLIVPSSLLGNWQQEIKRFAPSLNIRICHPAFDSGKNLETTPSQLSCYDLIVTTYGLTLKLEWLSEVNWHLVIADESQAIKNPQARQTLAVKKIKGHAKFALTGTPIENNLSDLWSIFDFCCPTLLGKYSEFVEYNKKLRALSSFAPLRRLTAPYILRRKKTDPKVINDLPQKIECKAFCLLTKEQIALYQKTLKDLATELKNNESPENDIKRKGQILSYLLKFKQICNHPSQFLNDQIYDYRHSGKFFRLQEICETIKERGEKVLVFTQFREMTDILHAFLQAIFGKEGFVLHGGTAIRQRYEMVEKFQNEGAYPYFILSLKAGGTGLNLTQASHVIHFDRWWNPAVENQASDRAFRIGQKRNVLVHKFICRGTIEERIDLMIEDKKALASDVIETDSELKLTELSNDELLKLVSLDIHSAQSM